MIMSKKIKTTSQQLTRLFLSLFIILLLLVNLTFAAISITFIYNNAHQQAEEVIDTVRDNISDHDDHKNKKEWKLFLNAYLARQSNDAIAVKTPQGKTVYSEDGEELFKKTRGRGNFNHVVFLNNSAYYFQTEQEDKYQISVILNVNDLFTLITHLLLAIIILNLLAIIFSIPLIKRFSKKWSQPLEKIDQDIAAIENQRISKKEVFVPQEPAEIRHLAQSFNDLLEYQEQAIKREQQFVTDASHELKTPIAAIRGHINLIKRRGKDHPEIIAKSLKYIDSESGRMEVLVNELLELGRAKKQHQTIESIDLVSVIYKESQIIDQEYHCSIDLLCPVKLFYPIELKDFRLIIHNLLDNAAKYSKDNIKVTVELEKDDKNLVLIVKDQGIGIKKENHDKIFDRFYREDQAHSSKIKGTGIGLAIVKEIIEKYHGKIIVTANLPKGIIFKVELPL